MRAREFITEQRGTLPPEERDPMHNTYILPGIRNNDAYHTLRFGVAIARARADVGGYGADLPPWNAQPAFGQNAVVMGFNDTVDDVIDLALKMTDTPGGKVAASSEHSTEPLNVNKVSPVKGFKGYPR
jgi:hypothetical protein